MLPAHAQRSSPPTPHLCSSASLRLGTAPMAASLRGRFPWPGRCSAPPWPLFCASVCALMGALLFSVSLQRMRLVCSSQSTAHSPRPDAPDVPHRAALAHAALAPPYPCPPCPCPRCTCPCCPCPCCTCLCCDYLLVSRLLVGSSNPNPNTNSNSGLLPSRLREGSGVLHLHHPEAAPLCDDAWACRWLLAARLY